MKQTKTKTVNLVTLWTWFWDRNTFKKRFHLMNFFWSFVLCLFLFPFLCFRFVFLFVFVFCFFVFAFCLFVFDFCLFVFGEKEPFPCDCAKRQRRHSHDSPHCAPPHKKIIHKRKPLFGIVLFWALFCFWHCFVLELELFCFWNCCFWNCFVVVFVCG